MAHQGAAPRGTGRPQGCGQEAQTWVVVTEIEGEDRVHGEVRRKTSTEKEKRRETIKR